jgi:hypothetical protein
VIRPVRAMLAAALVFAVRRRHEQVARGLRRVATVAHAAADDLDFLADIFDPEAS